MADKNTKIQLVESDIPGAELPKPAEFCTVAILKDGCPAEVQKCLEIGRI